MNELELCWSFEAGQNLLALPVFDQGEIYLTARRFLIALEAKSGRQIWRRAMPRASSGTPLLLDERLLVSCEDGQLHHFDRKDGNLAKSWSLGYPAGRGPVSDGQTVIATCGGTRPAQTGGAVVAFDHDGTQRWRFETAKGFHSRATLDGARVYAANRDGCLYALSLNDGSLIWSLSNPGELFATPVVDDGHLFFTTQDGALRCIDRAGRSVWRRDFGDAFYRRAPVLDGGCAYLATKTGVQAIEPSSGETLWEYPVSEAADLTLLDERLIFGAGDGRVRGLNRDGELVWQWASPTGPRGQRYAADWLAPLAAGHLLLLTASLNQVLYAVNQ